MESVIGLGGDTDSTAALVGALAGARGGVDAIPQPWVDGLLGWPRTIAWMERLAARLAAQFGDDPPPEDNGPLPVSRPGLLARNLLFNGTVLTHVLRRMLPPY